MKNTYEQDFAFLEMMEPELDPINDFISMAKSGQMHKNKKSDNGIGLPKND